MNTQKSRSSTTYTTVPSEGIEALLNNTLSRISEQISEAYLPFHYCVYLGGGYARGEGGVWQKDTREDRLYNDLDFFSFATSRRDCRRLDAVLRVLSEQWSKKLGVEVDFAPTRLISRLKRDSRRLMSQELLRGYIKVAGSLKIKNVIASYPAEVLPIEEGLRLLVNRGMGLLFAAQRIYNNETKNVRGKDFVWRNLHKSILGSGDAFLINKHLYSWNLQERVEILEKSDIITREEFAAYKVAASFKLSPVWNQSEPIDFSDWLNYATKFRSCALKALDIAPNNAVEYVGRALKEDSRLHDGKRIKSGLRFLIKTKTQTPWASMWDEPLSVVFLGILSKVDDLIEGEKDVYSDKEWTKLLLYWRKFN